MRALHPLFYRTFIMQEPVSEGGVKQMIQCVQGGLRPRAARRT